MMLVSRYYTQHIAAREAFAEERAEAVRGAQHHAQHHAPDLAASCAAPRRKLLDFSGMDNGHLRLELCWRAGAD